MPSNQNSQPQSSQPTSRRPSPFESSELPPKPSGLSAGWIWTICIGVIVVLFNVLGEKSKSKTYVPTAEVFGQSAPAYSQAPEPALTPQLPIYEPPKSFESLPMPGVDNVLQEGEIRYCLSQKIRFQGWEPNVNTSSQSSVDAFNGAISDFNSRCGSYRYRVNVMNRVQSEVNAISEQLRFEGVNIATQNP